MSKMTVREQHAVVCLGMWLFILAVVSIQIMAHALRAVI